MKNRLIYACAEDEAFDILLVRIKIQDPFFTGKALAASKKLPPFQPPQDLDVDSLEVCSIFDFSNSMR